MAERMSPEAMLHELAEPVESLVHYHLEHAKEWIPSELVPYSLGRNFTDADPWRAEEFPLSGGVRSALYVNLLTEDNLPYYTETILRQAPTDHPLNVWALRWTAEEDRHSVVIREWIHTTRAFDPKVLESGRMKQMSGGIVPQPTDVVDMLVYTSFQELATRVAHSRTGKKIGNNHDDLVHNGHTMLTRVAADENMHHNFYRNAAQAALSIDPDGTVPVILDRIKNFDMPGTGIPDFKRHALAIAREGIYGVNEFLNSVVLPTLGKWAIKDMPDADLKTDEAKRARDEIFEGVIPLLETIAQNETKARERYARKQKEKAA